MRGFSLRKAVQVFGGNLVKAGDTAQRHGRFEFIVQQPEHMGDTQRADGGQRVNIGTADQDCRGAEGDGLEDVAAPPDTAIQKNGTRPCRRRAMAGKASRLAGRVSSVRPP